MARSRAHSSFLEQSRHRRAKLALTGAAVLVFVGAIALFSRPAAEQPPVRTVGVLHPTGKVQVEVWLEPGIGQGDLEKLFRAGLKPEQDKSQIVGAKLTSVRGTIDVNKLPNLAKQKGVRLVSLAK